MKNLLLVFAAILFSMSTAAQSKAIISKGKVWESFQTTVSSQAGDAPATTPAKLDYMTYGAIGADEFAAELSVIYGLATARRWQPTELVSALAAMQGSMSKSVPNLFLTSAGPGQLTLVVVYWTNGRWNYSAVNPTTTALDNGGCLYIIKTV